MAAIVTSSIWVVRDPAAFDEVRDDFPTDILMHDLALHDPAPDDPGLRS
ncbi:hypothetical protein [Sphingobium sp. MK2]